MSAEFPLNPYSPRAKTNRAGIVYEPTKSDQVFAEDVTKLDDEVVEIEKTLLNIDDAKIPFGLKIGDDEAWVRFLPLTLAGQKYVNIDSQNTDPFTFKAFGCFGVFGVVVQAGQDSGIQLLYPDRSNAAFFGIINGDTWLTCTLPVKSSDYIETMTNFKANGEIGVTTTIEVITALQFDGGVLQKKTKTQTITGGIITAISAESEWVNV